LNDQASDFVQTNGGMLGVAYSIKTSSVAELSFGLQGGIFQRKTDDNFTTDDQFVDGVFDPNAPSADDLNNQTKSYSTLSGGLYYQVRDNDGRDKAFVGASVFNAMEPNVSFFDVQDDNLPLSFKATAGYRVYQGMRFSVMPTARLINQADNNFLNLGSRFGYELGNSKDGVEKIELGLWYNTNDLGVFSVAYERPNLILGISYDLPVGTEINTAQNGIFELAVSFRLKSKRQPYISKKTTSIPLPDNSNDTPEVDEEAVDDTQDEAIESKEDNEVTSPIPVVKEEESKPDEDKVKEAAEEIDEDSTLTPEEKEVLEKTVQFDFNTGNLDEESRVFLDRVANILIRRKGLNVELIGHSCDLGPEHINANLSIERAESVKKYLIDKGISENRFTVKGLGESEPMKDNGTEAGRQDNRRVEFKVLN
ncbi:MAG: PorP/SprF family type IX secretion system membrane protein, partial [Bacteroidota bacterium]